MSTARTRTAPPVLMQEPLVVQARKEVSGAEAGSEAKLVLGQKILLFQVGHDPPVHHFLHDFGEDAQQGHWVIVLDGCSGPFLMDWDDVRRLQHTLHHTHTLHTPETIVANLLLTPTYSTFSRLLITSKYLTRSDSWQHSGRENEGNAIEESVVFGATFNCY